MIVHHRTRAEIARAAAERGFNAALGVLGGAEEHSGVWLSERPVGPEDAHGDTRLEIHLAAADELEDYLLADDEVMGRQWLVPASVLDRLVVRVEVIEP